MPKIGATPFGYRIAEQFGLPSCRRARRWCRSTFAPDALARYGDLSGVSLDVEVACGGGRFREKLLFTHRGLSRSGDPADLVVLDGRRPLAIDLLPGRDAASWLDRAARQPPALSTTCSRERWPQALRAGVVRSARLRDAAEASSARSDCATRRATARAGRSLPSGHARLQQGRSHAGRRGHARPVVEDDGSARPCPGSTSSARWSTSPAGSAATTSSGRGRPVTPRDSLREVGPFVAPRETHARGAESDANAHVAPQVDDAIGTDDRTTSLVASPRRWLSILPFVPIEVRRARSLRPFRRSARLRVARRRAGQDRPHGLGHRPHHRHRHPAEEHG